MPNYHPMVKKSKDVAARDVLISVIGAIIIGIIVFAPKIFATVLNFTS